MHEYRLQLDPAQVHILLSQDGTRIQPTIDPLPIMEAGEDDEEADNTS